MVVVPTVDMFVGLDCAAEMESREEDQQNTNEIRGLSHDH